MYDCVRLSLCADWGHPVPDRKPASPQSLLAWLIYSYGACKIYDLQQNTRHSDSNNKDKQQQRQRDNNNNVGVLQQQQRQHQQSHIIAVRPKYVVKLPVNQLVTGYK